MVATRVLLVLLAAAPAAALDVWFFNNHSDALELFWDPSDGSPLLPVGTIPSKGNLTQTTRAGHAFVYTDAAGDAQRQVVEATTAHVVMLSSRGPNAVDAVFRNEQAEPVDLYWEPPSAAVNGGRRVKVATVAPRGGQQVQLTHAGQRFSYDDADGVRRVVAVDAADAFHVLAPEVITVSCALTNAPKQATLDFEIFPAWAPRGAARFLELARGGFFAGVALHRVIDDFVASFGIHPDHHVRAFYHDHAVVDDVGRGVRFEPGTLCFAGHARHTRTTNLFFVMPGASDAQRAAFGAEPWDTPVGRVSPASYAAAVPLLNRTSATAPWGTGPDPDKLFKWGYEYIDRPPFAGSVTRLARCDVAEVRPRGKFPGHGALKGAARFLKNRLSPKSEL